MFRLVLFPADPPRSVSGLVWVIWPFYRGPGHVSECLGWVLGSSCVFRPADPPSSVPGHGLGNRAALLRHRIIGFRVRFFFVLPTPPLGAGGALGNFTTPTVAQDYVIFLLFGGII